MISLTEAIGLRARAHVAVGVDAIARVIASKGTEEERAASIERLWCQVCEEMKTKVIADASNMVNDIKNTRLTIATVGTEFGPGARKPHVSAFAEVKGDLVRHERNGQEVKK